jgi:protein O-mannosyl-transferase
MEDTPQNNRRLATIICGALLLMVALAFGLAVQCDFVNFDDDVYVYNNPHVSCGLTQDNAAWSFTAFHSCNWHPLTWLSHALDCQLYGSQHAAGHHLTNIVLHAAVAILLFLVLWQMTGRLWPSAFVAAVFAVHPLRVESVVWVAERKDLLSGLFFMLTLAAYLGYVRRPFSWARYLLVVALFVLGLMAKPMLVTLPFLLLLLDYWPLGRTRLSSCGTIRETTPALNETTPALNETTVILSAAKDLAREGDATEILRCAQDDTASEPHDHSPNVPLQPIWRLIAEKLPLLLLAGASSVVTSLAQQKALVPVDIVPVSLRISNALVSYVAYIGQFFYPVGLAIFYPFPEDGLPTWKVVAAVIVLLSVSGAALLAWRRMPYLFVGWFWYVGMLVPVIGLVQVGSQAMADRYTYLPQIGLCIAVVWTIASIPIAAPIRRRAYATAAALLLAGLMACTWQQTAYWRNSETLWTRAVACTPDSASLHDRLGNALAGDKQLDEAIVQYRQAIRINPEYAAAHNSLGKALAETGHSDAAVTEYRMAIKLNPAYADAHNNLAVIFVDRGQLDPAIDEFRRALAIKPEYALAQKNLAKALAKKGRYDEAIAAYRNAIKSDPDSADAHNDLGVILATRGQLDMAITEFRKALALRPDFADVHGNLGTALQQQGKMPEALTQWREEVRLQPNNLRAVNQLAWTMATWPAASVRNGAEAAELAQWAVKLSGGKEPVPLGTLAAAYAEAGRFAEAVKAAEQAIALAAARNDAVTADTLRRQCQRYRAGTPYRESPIRPQP